MKVWIVAWEDLTSVWSSKEKALEFVFGEQERIGATISIIKDHGDWIDLRVIYADGYEDAIGPCIAEYEVDELPYIVIEK